MLLMTFALPKGAVSETALGAAGVAEIKWVAKTNRYQGRVTTAAWVAVHNTPALDAAVVDHAKNIPLKPATVRFLQRAAAVADGNGFFGPLAEPPGVFEKQYRVEAEDFANFLEAVGVDPDAFVAGRPDPGHVFRGRITG